MLNTDRSPRLSKTLKWATGIAVSVLLTIVVVWTSQDQPETEQSILNPISLDDPAIVLPEIFTGDFRQESVRTLTNKFVDQPAPDFTLPSLEGEELSLSQFQGQPVLINFWTSWCIPCRTEMPDLVAAYERYKEQGLIILGVNFTSQDTLPEVHDFVKEYGISYPILLDESGDIAGNSYNLLGLPMSVFVSKTGTVKRLVVGPLGTEEIDRYISEIVDEK